MRTLEPQASAVFCTTCGSSLAAGGCPRCDAPSRRASGAARVAARLRVLVQVAALLAAATASALALRLDARQHQLEAVVATQSDRDVAAAQQLEERLAAAERAINALNARPAAVETKVERPDLAAVAERVRRSVFTVQTTGGTGSAFLFETASGPRLITNFHVVGSQWTNGRTDVTVRREDQTYPATVTAVSAADDLAVIDLQGSFDVLKLRFGLPAVAEQILAVGSPFGLDGSVTTGVVSSVRFEGGVQYLQFSAPVSPGNSGGPVVDREGLVVGVVVAKVTGPGAEGLSFAIPVSRVCALVAC